MLRPPREFADPPAVEDAALVIDPYGQPHDLLSGLLRSVRLSGERIVAYAPLRTFSISFADTGTLHIIEEGELVLRFDGDPHVERVSRGDVILLPRGDRHDISDVASACTRVRAPATGDDAPDPRRRAGSAGIHIGDPQASHLLASLPAAIILRDGRGQRSKGSSGPQDVLYEMVSPSQGSA